MQQPLFEINRKKSDAQREGKYIPQKKKIWVYPVLMIKTWGKKDDKLLTRLSCWYRQSATNVITSFVKHFTLIDKQDVPFLHYIQKLIVKTINCKWQNLLLNIPWRPFFFPWLHILSPSQEHSKSTKPLAAQQSFCHPSHLDVII